MPEIRIQTSSQSGGDAAGGGHAGPPADGALLEVRYEDDGAGEPAVLVGGLTSTAEVWELQARELAPSYRVLRPDNRGSGGTRAEPDDGLRTPARFAADLLAFLDALELPRVHLVGASMGGMIVQELALRHPGRVATLTIACSSFGGPHAVSASQDVLRAMVEGSAEGADPTARRRSEEVLIHPETREKRPERLAFYLETKERHPHSAEELARRAAGIARFDVRDALASLRVPTLVMAGTHDALIPPDNARLIAERIPGAELVLVPDGGHIFFVEQAEAFDRHLLDFWGRHPIGDV